LIKVYDEARRLGINGIFSAFNLPFRQHYETLRLSTSKVLLKWRQAASNWLLPREIYDKVGPFRDVGMAYDSDYTTRTRAYGFPIVCLAPSYVQNIGILGAYNNDWTNTAIDFVGERNRPAGSALVIHSFGQRVRRLLKGAKKDIKFGNYRIIAPLRAGCCWSYEAQNKAGASLVLKLLPLKNAANQDAIERILGDSNRRRAITHPNLAKYFEGGCEGEYLHVAFRYIQAPDLLSSVQFNGCFEYGKALPLLKQIASALAKLHEFNITHGNVRPGNVLIEQNKALLTDYGFGLHAIEKNNFVQTIKSSNGGDERLFRILQGVDRHARFEVKICLLREILEYSAPEQFSPTHEVDSKTDIYCFGATAYYALTGRSPFSHIKLSELPEAIFTRQIVPLEKHCPDIPPDFAELVMRCLHPEKSRRFENASELSDALANI
jgi:serine/threonine protein kinase